MCRFLGRCWDSIHWVIDVGGNHVPHLPGLLVPECESPCTHVRCDHLPYRGLALDHTWCPQDNRDWNCQVPVLHRTMKAHKASCARDQDHTSSTRFAGLSCCDLKLTFLYSFRGHEFSLPYVHEDSPRRTRSEVLIKMATDDVLSCDV